MPIKGIASEGLPDVAFALADRNIIIVLIADRPIISLISEIKKEKILSMEQLMDVLSLVDTFPFPSPH